MANEIQMRISMKIKSGNLNFQNKPTSFSEDMTGSKGPVPGALSVPTTGIDVDLSQLNVPGMCLITNLDATNYVVVGVYNVSATKFFPMFEILPGKQYPLRLYRDFGADWYNTGTGTDPKTSNRLHIKADTAACNVRVEAFEV